jgi:hypothetical protein
MPQSGAAAITFSKGHTWQAEAQNGKTNKKEKNRSTKRACMPVFYRESIRL